MATDNLPRCVVVCDRPIEPFEEITIDYGSDYFGEKSGRVCLCGEATCRYPPSSSRQVARSDRSGSEVSDSRLA